MKKCFCMLLIAAHLSACATYETQSVPFKAPQTYSNYRNISGLLLGAEAYADKRRAENTFGFDILGAGVLPVQVVLDNQSGQTVEVVYNQTFLVDAEGGHWKVLSNNDAVQRIRKATQGGAIAGGAGRGAAFGAGAGALLGLALGVVSGGNAVSSAVKGGVLGGAGGAIVGGAGSGDDLASTERAIGADVREKGIQGKMIPQESLASGFIFFPAEAARAGELRLQLHFRESGRIQTLNLKLQ